MLYPLKFKPIFKEKVWGGNRLQTVLNKNITSGKTGESWEISGLRNNVSVVSEGKYSGKSIQELIDKHKSNFLGKKIYEKFGNVFPLLIKFIDAFDDLSVQVHPDDKFAEQQHNETGKNEMWYILDTMPNSELILGVKKTVTKDEYIKITKEKIFSDLLNSVTVNAGDAFYIPAGRIHAIMKGVLLAEIQQSSDLTYRIYDWDRKGLSGKYRDLHNELAAEVVELQAKKNYFLEYKKNDAFAQLTSCEQFTVNRLKLLTPQIKNYSSKGSFVVLMCVSGTLSVIHKNIKYFIRKGETILIPAIILAETELVSEKKAEVLEIYI
ncbi:MAG: class I mannose-6-phosphate isomerase [Bacteroidales bacterium]|nr:class I mannose-6-phosphate isomerase [Bacteroidales bacterium]